MNGIDARDAAPEAALRARLAQLAVASGLEPPPLEVDEDDRREKDGEPRILMAAVRRGDDDQYRIVVAPALLAASAAEQTWHLAAALGWWASPEPRRHRRRSRIAHAAILVPHLLVGLAGLFDNVPIPLWLALLGGPLLGSIVLPVALASSSRGEQQLLDAAGRQVLRAAGHDPVTVARLSFGHRADPPWYRRPLGSLPSPSRRLAAAGAQDLSPARPLY